MGIKQWIIDWLSDDTDEDRHDSIEGIGRGIRKKNYISNTSMPVPETIGHSGGIGFQRDFSGWNMKLHRASNGHIIEMWKNWTEIGNYSGSNPPPHKFVLVKDDEDVLSMIPETIVACVLEDS